MSISNKIYLKNDVTYTDDGRLLDYKGDSVMMDWEDDIMRDAAKLICRDGGKILNIGFGLGIIDNYIQSHNPQEHWIIEAHPQVINKMKEEGWDKKKNVTCIFDRWQNVINDLPEFDGIYFDTWADPEESLIPTEAPKILLPGGKLLLFDGRLRENTTFKRMGLVVENHITTINKVDENQTSRSCSYFPPEIKAYYHQLLIKPKNK
jgi:type IV protein arginine methyltransferase